MRGNTLMISAMITVRAVTVVDVFGLGDERDARAISHTAAPDGYDGFYPDSLGAAAFSQSQSGTKCSRAHSG